MIWAALLLGLFFIYAVIVAIQYALLGEIMEQRIRFDNYDELSILSWSSHYQVAAMIPGYGFYVWKKSKTIDFGTWELHVPPKEGAEDEMPWTWQLQLPSEEE